MSFFVEKPKVVNVTVKPRVEVPEDLATSNLYEIIIEFEYASIMPLFPITGIDFYWESGTKDFTIGKDNMENYAVKNNTITFDFETDFQFPATSEHSSFTFTYTEEISGGQRLGDYSFNPTYTLDK